MTVKRLHFMVKALVDTPAAASSDEKNDFDAMSITVSELISSMNNGRHHVTSDTRHPSRKYIAIC